MKARILFALLVVVATATSSFVGSMPPDVNETVTSKRNIGSFRVHRQGKNVVLNWSASGVGVAQFVVERSYDGEYFDVMGTLDNLGQASFQFKDVDVPPGYLHYRICSVDANGNVQEISPVVEIRIVQRK